jgi:hypothetical protein
VQTTAMRKSFKYFIVSFLLILSSSLKTTVNAQSDFVTDINYLIEACKNDFADLKDQLVVSNDKTDIYQCKYQIKGYSTTYLAVTKATGYTYVYASLPTTGSTANDDCDRIARDFASIPDCELYDSQHDPNSNEDRRLQGKIANGSGYIYVNAVLELSGDSQILVSIQKPLVQ